jgi:hypothetical protein
MPSTMRFQQYVVATAAIWSATTLTLSTVAGFQAAPAFAPKRAREAQSALYSSAGGGGPPPPPPDNNKGEGKGNSWDDFLDPNKRESESMRKAREYVSDNSLPISFDHVDDEDDDEDVDEVDDDDFEDDVDGLGDSIPKNLDSSALVGQPKGGDLLRGGPSKDALKNNPYMAVVSKLSPSELISKFTGTAHPRVQAAVKTTILGLIGGLPKLAFDTTTITTGQRLASLMFQLQMTGYMFKNADYRLSLAQSLGAPPSSMLLAGNEEDEDDEEENIMNGKVRGKLRIRYRTPKNKKDIDSDETSEDDDDSDYDAATTDGLELEVDAASYMSELRQEVSQLRDDLMTTRKEKEEALRKDLLLYIRTLPEQELRSLTNTMSPDVLVAMKGLVQAVMSGIGEGEIGPDTITEQSGEAMAQLCMWQLSIGYNLRTLEVREEMKKSLITGGIDATSEEGAFE